MSEITEINKFIITIRLIRLPMVNVIQTIQVKFLVWKEPSVRLRSFSFIKTLFTSQSIENKTIRLEYKSKTKKLLDQLLQ